MWGAITLLQVSSAYWLQWWSCCFILCSITSRVTGHISLVTLLVTLIYMWINSGRVTGHVVIITVKADEDLNKYVLECSRLGCTLWKHCFPQDTEDEAAIGISSEDEVDGMPLVDHQVRRAVRPTPAVPAPPRAAPPAAAGSAATVSTAATASTGTSTDVPAPDEVIIKKSALFIMKRQVAALIQGEELSAGGADARDTPEVPYQVPTISREDTRCPICHLPFKTPYHLRKHMDVH